MMFWLAVQSVVLEADRGSYLYLDVNNKFSQYFHYSSTRRQHTHTHTRLTALFPGLPGWAGTRKVKPILILLKQETVSGSGISWNICKSAPRSRQITMPAPQHSVFYRLDALPAAQPIASKHWRLTRQQPQGKMNGCPFRSETWWGKCLTCALCSHVLAYIYTKYTNTYF